MDENLQNKLLINKYYQKVFDKQRVCCFPGCNEIAINSHILEKNGILKNIAENNHLFCLETKYNHDDEIVKFKKIGINKALTFKGFCNKHDNSIFKEIENGAEINYYDYKTQLLLSYRGISNELRKKEQDLEISNLIVKNEKFDDIINKKFINERKKFVEYGYRDINNYKIYLERNLKNIRYHNFIFNVFEYPKIDVCTSAFFTKASLKKLAFDQMKCAYTLPQAIIFTVIPTTTNLILILGYLKKFKNQLNNYIMSFGNLSKPEQLKKISDFLLLNIETWVCSPNLYENQLKKNENKIINIFLESMNDDWSEVKIEFNMFEDLISN